MLGNCVGAAFTLTVTVNPKPFVSTQTTSTCSASPFTVTPVNAVTSNIVPASTTYAWSAPVVTGGMTGGVSASGSSTITGTLINPTNVVQTATYTVTPTSGSAGNCVGEPFTVTVSINPKPFVTPRTETICSGGSFTTTLTNSDPNATTIIPAGTTYTWSAPTVTGNITGGAAGTSQSTIFGTLTNPTNIPQTATYNVTPTSGTTGNCVGDSFTVTVTVNPKPVIFDRVATICSATAFTLTPVNSTPSATTIVPAATTYTWTVVDNANVTGDSDQATPQTTISQTLTNLTNVAQTVVYTVTPVSGASGTCPGATFTITVTVNPKPTVANEVTSVCSASTFTVLPVTGNGNIIASGTTYSWPLPVVDTGITGGATGTNQSTISGTLTNTTNAPLTATYTVTPLSGLCPGAPFTVVVTVNPKPVIPNQTATICSATAFTTSPVNAAPTTIVPINTTYTWTVATNTNVTGQSNQTSPQSSITQTLTNTSNTAQNVVYTVTPTSGDAGNCVGATFTVTVTVNPKPYVSAQTVSTCSGTAFPAITPVNGTANNHIIPTGTTYAWSAPVVTGGLTGGAPASGQTNINGNLTNPTNVNQTATYTVTPTSGSYGNCVGEPFIVTVNVNAKPFVTPRTETICSGGSFTTTLTNSDPNATTIIPAGTTYTWSAPTVTGGITGGLAGTSQSTIFGTLTNPTNIPQTATYYVTPTSGTTGNCVGASFTITVTVNPKPVIFDRVDTICSATAFTLTPANGNPLVNTIVPIGTTYTWTVVDNTNVTGDLDQTIGQSTISQNLTNLTNTAQTLVYTVTPRSGDAGNCVGATFTITVTVNPRPEIPIQTVAICSGGTFGVSLQNATPTSQTIVPLNTTYSWGVPSVTGGITGGIERSDKNNIYGTLTNPTNVPQTATYVVTPTSGDSGNCVGPTFIVEVTVNPKPVIFNSVQTTCSGTAFVNSPVNSNPSTTTIVPANTTYTWTVATNTNVTGQSDQTVGQSNISQTLTNLTNVAQSVIYTVTPTSGAAGNCVGATFTITVTVNPTPVIPNQTVVICSNDTFDKVLTNGNPTAATIIPVNTTYSWSAPTVTGDITGGIAGSSQTSIFGALSNPTVLVQTATYTVTATSGYAGSCISNTFDVVVTVNPLPVLTLGTIMPVNTMDVQFLIPYTTNFNLTNFTLTTNNSSALPSFETINNSVITASPLEIPLPASNEPGSYAFDLIITDSNGCISMPNTTNLVINMIKVLDKNAKRMTIPSDATNRNGARGAGSGRTNNGQIISAPNTTRIALSEAGSITETAAAFTVSIPNIRGGAVTSRGICWSTSINPTIANTIVSDSGTIGNYSISISGALGGTKYYVRSFITNNLGTVYSRQVSFSTTAILPTVTTTAITAITTTTASSGGTVTATGGATITAQGICWSTTATPTIANTKTTNGTITPFTSNITGLSNGTTYYVRAYATNSLGTSYGNEISFRTLAVLPTITTTSINSITENKAYSGGTVTTTGGAAITAQGVCWSTTTGPTIADNKTNNGTSSPFTSTITGLNYATTYYVRAYATNSVGTSYGNEKSFTTLAIAPTVTTTAISSITVTSASSGGTVTSTGGDAITEQGVCWSTTTAPTTADNKTTDGTSSPFASSITGLAYATTYYVRSYATNSIGTSYGSEISFTTLAVSPTVTTTAISTITSSTASSGGTVTATGGAAITAQGVCWSTTSAPTIAGSKTTDGTTSPFTSSITGLAYATTYYVRAYATNSIGTSYGNVISFTTLAVAPTVTTTAISTITATSASSGGTVTVTGGAVITAQGVCWSTTTAPTIANSKTTDGTTTPFASSITGLTEGTTYFVRAYATNSVGTSYGNEISFTTTANFVSSGLKLYLDASNSTSYPGTGTAWTDLSGNGNNGTLIGGLSYNSTEGGSIAFSGGTSNDYVSIANSASLNLTTAGTLSIWVNPNSLTQRSLTNLIGRTIDGAPNGQSYYLYWTGGNITGIIQNGGTYNSISTPVPTVLGWYNYVFSWGNGYLKLYKNGVQVSTPVAKTVNAQSLTTTVNIGGSIFGGAGGNQNTFNGKIPIVQIYNRDLSDAEVLQNFNSLRSRFATLIVAPTVTTSAISSIAGTSATSGGTVTYTGGAAITAQGVCWSTTTAPTIANSKTTDGTTSPFTSSITGLAGGTTYYVRAYATNSVGTSYGNEISFTTTSSVITAGLKLHFDTSNTSSYPGSGNTITDLSGNGNHGTLVNSSGFNNAVAGGVLTFNGTNQYISTSYTPSTTCTISMWFYNNLNYTDWNRGIFSTFSPTTHNGFYMGTSNIGTYKPSLNLWYNGNTALNSISSVLAINTWYNITVTSGSGSIKIYLNGSLINTLSGSTTHADVLNIGRTRFDSNYWSGYIGNTMVYDTVLSDQDVSNNFNSLKTRFGY